MAKEKEFANERERMTSAVAELKKRQADLERGAGLPALTLVAVSYLPQITFSSTSGSFEL